MEADDTRHPGFPGDDDPRGPEEIERKRDGGPCHRKRLGDRPATGGRATRAGEPPLHRHLQHGFMRGSDATFAADEGNRNPRGSRGIRTARSRRSATIPGSAKRAASSWRSPASRRTAIGSSPTPSPAAPASSSMKRDFIPPAGVTAIRVRDSRRVLGLLGRNFFGHPSAALCLIAVVGTNGKTTITYLLEAILRAAGHSVGVLGTVNYRYGGKTLPRPEHHPRILRDAEDPPGDGRSRGHPRRRRGLVARHRPSAGSTTAHSIWGSSPTSPRTTSTTTKRWRTTSRQRGASFPRSSPAAGKTVPGG